MKKYPIFFGILSLMIINHTTMPMLLPTIARTTAIFAKAPLSTTANKITPIQAIEKLFENKTNLKTCTASGLQTALLVSAFGGPKQVAAAGILNTIGFLPDIKKAVEDTDPLPIQLGAQWLKEHNFPEEIVFYIEHAPKAYALNNSFKHEYELPSKITRDIIQRCNHQRLCNLIALERCHEMARVSDNKPSQEDFDQCRAVIYDALQECNLDEPKDTSWCRKVAKWYQTIEN